MDVGIQLTCTDEPSTLDSFTQTMAELGEGVKSSFGNWTRSVAEKWEGKMEPSSSQQALKASSMADDDDGFVFLTLTLLTLSADEFEL